MSVEGGGTLRTHPPPTYLVKLIPYPQFHLGECINNGIPCIPLLKGKENEYGKCMPLFKGKENISRKCMPLLKEKGNI